MACVSNSEPLKRRGELTFFLPVHIPCTLLHRQLGSFRGKNLGQLLVEITQTSSQLLASGELMSLVGSQPVGPTALTEHALWGWGGRESGGVERRSDPGCGGFLLSENPLERASGRVTLQTLSLLRQFPSRQTLEL